MVDYPPSPKKREDVMAVAELARMLFAANTILEKVSSAVGLSKRAALALAIMSLEENSASTMTNQYLQDQFLKYKVSTAQSVQKDASAAKSELLEHKHIEIQGKVSVFAISEQGRGIFLKMYQAMDEAIEEQGLSDEERSVLRKLVGMPEPKTPNLDSPKRPASDREPPRRQMTHKKSS